jgi:hypothetical protein
MTGYVHASGQDADGCIACQVDALLEGVNPDTIAGCRCAEPDDDEPVLCKWCSHTIEPDE